MLGSQPSWALQRFVWEAWGQVISRTFVGLTIALSGVLQSPIEALAQLPFDLTEQDVVAVDSSAIRWADVKTYMGGAEAQLHYEVEEPLEGECRAAALMGLLRLRDHYVGKTEESPVTLRLAFRCGAAYRGNVEYDGLIVRVEQRDLSGGQLVYQGRRRGLP